MLGRKKIAVFFDTLAETIIPESELNWETPLDLAIAVVLSAQCTDKAVNKATAELWKVCREPADYLKLGHDAVLTYIKSIGLYRNKTKSVIGICQMVKDEFGGAIPDNRDDLMKLPGVGRKSANVILNVVFNQPTMAVDTHVFRVANRIGLTCQPTPEKTELELLKKVPKQHMLHAHHYLILHGRYTCVARKPKCGACLVREVCNYSDKVE